MPEPALAADAERLILTVEARLFESRRQLNEYCESFFGWSPRYVGRLLDYTRKETDCPIYADPASGQWGTPDTIPGLRTRVVKRLDTVAEGTTEQEKLLTADIADEGRPRDYREAYETIENHALNTGGRVAQLPEPTEEK